jgi:hypothetical protein
MNTATFSNGHDATGSFTARTTKGAESVAVTKDSDILDGTGAKRVRPQRHLFGKVAINEEFIKASALSIDGEVGVQNFHRQLFRRTHAVDFARLSEGVRTANRAIEWLAARLKPLEEQLTKLDRFRVTEGHNPGASPWTFAEATLCALLVGIGLGLLAIGVNTIATYLRNSGVQLFAEHLWLAYLLSALNLGLAVLLDCIYSWIPTDTGKRRYFAGLATLGTIGGTVWIVTFSSIFPAIDYSISDVISAIGADTNGPSKVLEGVFVGSQIVTELCVAAVLFVHVKEIWGSHRPDKRVEPNVLYVAYGREVEPLRKELVAARMIHAENVGELDALKAAEETFVLFALAKWNDIRMH